MSWLAWLDSDAAVFAALLTPGVVVALAMIASRVLLERRTRRALALTVQTPPSLHPVIDGARCIGSFSCIKACPEGDLIGAVDGVATLMRAADCIGHGRCKTDCPTGAIRLVMGTKEVGVDLPETSMSFESSRPGVYVIGELAGMGLIKGALRQGVALAQELADVDGEIVIVGAGPAGLACASVLARAGKSVVVFESGVMGGAVVHYPRDKVVVTDVIRVPGFGRFGKKPVLSKDELLDELQRLAAWGGVTVTENAHVIGVDGDNVAGFVVRIVNSAQRARAVVLACGLRGTPRALGVDGEATDPRVHYRLKDPHAHAGKNVVVIGGGDSAVEAATALSMSQNAPARVTLLHRGNTITRANSRNIAALTHSTVHVVSDAHVIALDEHGVVTNTGHVDADTIIACLGGQLPSAFLHDVGVAVTRHHGDTPQDEVAQRREARVRRTLALTLWCLGAALLSGLTLVGGDYYSIPVDERDASPLHEFLKPAGLWGHGVGIAATVFMLANFLYAVRKRTRALKGVSTIRTWLTLHVFVGIMSPLVIAFHAAFLTNNLLAVWTWTGLSVVVGTGVIGRFLYGVVNRAGAPARMRVLFRWWLVVHVSSAVVMVFLIAAHVAVVTWLGYLRGFSL